MKTLAETCNLSCIFSYLVEVGSMIVTKSEFVPAETVARKCYLKFY